MPRRLASSLAVPLAGIALLAAACSPSGPARERAQAPQPGHPAASSHPARDGKPGPALATAATVRVVMNDRFRYRPDAIMVKAGLRVTFAVTNAGKLPHEFILGDQATQLDHERQMQAAATGGGHVHTHRTEGHAARGTGGLTVPPGQTRRLTRTFHRPGMVLYGCHVLGHWPAGMKGTIVVVAADHPLALPAVSRP